MQPNVCGRPPELPLRTPSEAMSSGYTATSSRNDMPFLRWACCYVLIYGVWCSVSGPYPQYAMSRGS